MKCNYKYVFSFCVFHRSKVCKGSPNEKCQSLLELGENSRRFSNGELRIWGGYIYNYGIEVNRRFLSSKGKKEDASVLMLDWIRKCLKSANIPRFSVFKPYNVKKCNKKRKIFYGNAFYLKKSFTFARYYGVDGY